jgi:hypothetical protein
MNGDGIADDTGWTGDGDGFLVIDRNGDGLILGASELSFLAEKAGATSDLDALSALDSNRDGKIDGSDERFGELKVWVDADGDGATDSGELRSLAEHDIASISLAGQASRQSVKIGENILLSTAVFTRTDGSTGTAGDAALAFRPGAGSRIRNGSLRIDGGLLSRPLTFEADGVDFDGPAGTESGLGTPDRRLALIAQDMAAFGAQAGEGEWGARSDRTAPRFDYFAG